MTAFARLEADGLADFDLEEAEGIVVSTLDIGFPSIRSVTDSRPDADGEYDQTQFIGARAVLIAGTVVGNNDYNRQQVFDRLCTFLRPNIRPYLVYQLEPDGDERRIRLRAENHAAPILHPVTAEFTAAWRGPDGVQESTTETSETISAAADVAAGRSYDLTFDRTYPASAPIGATTVTNDGNINAYPILRLYGPCTGPNIENQTQGKTLELPGLEVAAGDYIEIDTRNRTIRLLGDADQSRYSFLDFDTSAWWSLDPGDNDLRYYPTSFTAGAEAEIIFRSVWL